MDRIDNTENEKFLSNNSQCRSGMEKSEKIKSNTMLWSIKVLGISLNPDNDTLKFEFSSVVDTTAQYLITKRLILSVIAWVYDPLGLLSPAIILDQAERMPEADPMCLPYITEGSHFVSNWNKFFWIFGTVWINSFFLYPHLTMNLCVPS